MLAQWFDLRAGHGCPLCKPRPAVSERSYFVCKLSVSSLYLARNQAYRGSCAIVYDSTHATRPSELPPEQWMQFCNDAWRVESVVSQVFQPDHVNLECLGNSVPHLHMGIIPRYRTDPRWGQPIWTSSKEEMVQVIVTIEECEELARILREELLASSID